MLKLTMSDPRVIQVAKQFAEILGIKWDDLDERGKAAYVRSVLRRTDSLSAHRIIAEQDRG